MAVLFADTSPALIGTSPIMLALDADVTAAARSSAKVLITGESGAGKEVVARLIHDRSSRRHMPLVTINCAGVPDTLLESELFGHVRGSFTGAYRDKAGLLEQANGGTVFLDEIGEMSLRMQALLLRFLETGEIQRVGDDRDSVRVNVRVICATNRLLPDRVSKGEFREDLYYRLNVVHLRVPALRERADDVPLLIEHFSREFTQRHRVPRPVITDEARARLLLYDWPGNVRELRNVVERVVVRANGGTVRVSDLPADLANVAPRLARVPAEVLSPAAAYADAVARDVLVRLTRGEATFWAAVHDPFMARDLSRDVLRRLMHLALHAVGGQYSGLTTLFHMKRDEVKRLMNFLRKYQCLVSIPTAVPTATGPQQEVA